MHSRLGPLGVQGGVLSDESKIMINPESEEALSALVADASGPFRIVGGSTRTYGRIVDGEELSTAGLSGVGLYEPGALTMVAQAGTPVAQIEETLSKEGQRLAFEPTDLRTLLGVEGQSTIGAVFATNASGPRRVQAGAARDFLLGVRFVDGLGQVVKNGGRVMKNVTGYDLVKLMAGSHGTLGILTEVSFKVLPVPETEATLTLRSKEVAAVMSDALCSPFEISGAATGPVAEDGVCDVHLRLEGFRHSVLYRTAELCARLRRFGEVQVETDAKASAALWRSIRDVVGLRDHTFVARTVIKPSQLARLIEDVSSFLTSKGADPSQLEIRADWGGGLVWLGLKTDALAQVSKGNAMDDGEPSDSGAKAMIAMLQGWCSQHGGHSTMVKAPASVRRDVQSFQPELPTIAALSQGLRKKFDPRGILNPGIML